MDVDIICSTEPFIWLIDWFGLVCFREKENAPHLGAALGRKGGTDPPLSLPVCAGGERGQYPLWMVWQRSQPRGEPGHGRGGKDGGTQQRESPRIRPVWELLGGRGVLSKSTSPEYIELNMIFFSNLRKQHFFNLVISDRLLNPSESSLAHLPDNDNIYHPVQPQRWISHDNRWWLVSTKCLKGHLLNAWKLKCLPERCAISTMNQGIVRSAKSRI